MKYVGIIEVKKKQGLFLEEKIISFVFPSPLKTTLNYFAQFFGNSLMTGRYQSLGSFDHAMQVLQIRDPSRK